jgi:putative salt-induced outer membrane protein YdiY
MSVSPDVKDVTASSGRITVQPPSENQQETRTMNLPDVLKTALVSLLLIATCVIDGQVRAEDTQPVPADKQAKQAWTPPPPPPDQYDWIQLTSGEWLKGEFKVLYDEQVEFDSDKLGLLQLDWADIKQVRGHAVHAVNIDGRMDDVVGNFRVTDGKVQIVAGESVREFNRTEIVSVAHGKPTERNYWSAKFTMGMNISEGNTKRRDLNLGLDLKRRTSNSRFLTDYLGYYSETEGIKTDNNHRLSSSFDIFKSKKFFWRPLLGEYFRDPFQNISYRLTVGAGAGYSLIDTAKTEWDISAGPGFRYTKFENVEAGENGSESTPALWASTDYEHELNSRMDLLLDYSTVVGNQESGGYTHHAVASLETELLSWLDFDLSFIWDHIQNPTPDEEGITPEKNDYRFIIGLALDY